MNLLVRSISSLRMISEVVQSLQVYVACECGPDSNCTFSGFFQQKKCICKPGYFAVDGKCVACLSTCKNGNCVNEGGKDICKCNPGYGNYGETTCRDCDCGPDSNCTFSGPFGQKKCICKPGYREVHGKCVDCNCGEYSKSCGYNGFGHKICDCLPGYVDNHGTCDTCICKNGNCVNEGGKYICKCGPGYGNSRGTSCIGI
ncbi:hypothetical protein AVEN_176432-1 [Araneus ventricosus]|uniref:EGF-like domain-containing protein n=1 Tax=Araneus ventricosus TaxID=182803 RepID=A0A4Y2PK88_ARAVE|nr:hypothetical protein AVEN_176432-1 [Araneus ventricosus]